MRKILISCLLKTLFYTTMVVFLNFVLDIGSMTFINFIQGSIIFFVLIVCADVILDRIRHSEEK